eukprot:TRINITY_DN8939_c0_g1_i3.p1 TRINITY_DN8939_c0_g1~~TRINITY_DN8939_c0_g1_i3.p1  ORF type:complete len:142 (+),score=43.87 TRINITY_DN8939_c0_g1_i3:64-489(+)
MFPRLDRQSLRSLILGLVALSGAAAAAAAAAAWKRRRLEDEDLDAKDPPLFRGSKQAEEDYFECVRRDEEVQAQKEPERLPEQQEAAPEAAAAEEAAAAAAGARVAEAASRDTFEIVRTQRLRSTIVRTDDMWLFVNTCAR